MSYVIKFRDFEIFILNCVVCCRQKQKNCDNLRNLWFYL